MHMKQNYIAAARHHSLQLSTFSSRSIFGWLHVHQHETKKKDKRLLQVKKQKTMGQTEAFQLKHTYQHTRTHTHK